MDVKRVGENIARYRKQAGMTQKELAEKLNVIDKTISRWECGYGLPDMSMLVPMAEIFGVPVEAIIDENYQPKEQEKTKQETVAKPKKRLIVFIIVALVVLTIGCVIIAVVLGTGKDGGKEVFRVDKHCWETAFSSSADDVFITAFGSEETMSLELVGGNAGGTFTCTESWRETSAAKILNCAVYGTYKTDGDKMYFYADKVSDPSDTAKLKTAKELGFDAFVAEFTEKEGVITVIRFVDTVKNSEKSAFGRWTKYKKYFSENTSEITFERVTGGAFTDKQYEKLPELVLAETDYKTFNVTLSKSYYFIGEKFLTSVLDVTFGPVYDLKDVLKECAINLKGKYITEGDDLLTVDYTNDGNTYHKEFGLKLFQPSWYYAATSTAKDVMFTCYSSTGLLCFGSMELFEDGTFIYNETYGRTSFTTAAVITGTYEKADGEIRFVAEEYTSNIPNLRFETNVLGTYCRATYTEEEDGKMTSLVFMTSTDKKAFFGTRSDDSLGDSLSAVYGEVRFDRVVDGEFSDKIKELFDYYLELYGS